MSPFELDVLLSELDYWAAVHELTAAEVEEVNDLLSQVADPSVYRNLQQYVYPEDAS